jgi:hypothetical protein
MFVAIMFCMSQILYASSLAGVSMPDSIKVNNETLILNGLGLREKYWVDIYVAGLYLPSKMSDGAAIMKANVDKRIQVEFIYSSVPKSKMIAVLEENISNNPQFSSDTVAQIRQCGSWMQDFTSGDIVMFDYAPNTQTTTIYINDDVRGTIQSKEFMEAIFAMYVGKYPATEALKQGLLGN